MRLLKKKLAQRQNNADAMSAVKSEVKVEYSEFSVSTTTPTLTLKDVKREPSYSETKSRTTSRGGRVELDAKKKANSSKNIVKNYARTMVTFAISRMAFQYIKHRLEQEKLEYQDFKDYLAMRKENMDGISSLRRLLLIEAHDDGITASIKRVFAFCSEIFLKYFSVNWIFNSKLGDKISYVKSRFKMLRRIRDPEHFTYFKL